MEQNLNINEKQNILEDVFTKEYIDDIGEYIGDAFKKIDGFDYRWNSLITSKPLLFEDTDYLRVRNYVRNECTEEEIEAYKSGKLRDLYATFESMLVCNLQYYDRIMSFCTMLFLKYVRLSNDECVKDRLNKLPYYFEMTPTQIWCCALTSEKSTKWELEYAWRFSKKSPLKHIPTNNQSWLEANFNVLYKNIIFQRFVEYCAVRTGVNGFKQCLFADVTSNQKLARVCSKFTKTSMAIDEEQLKSIGNCILSEIDSIKPLSASICNELSKQFSDDMFAVFVFRNEFFVTTNKFKLKVEKDETGKITKEYMANNYECFIAESYLKQTINEQLRWSIYKEPEDLSYERQILKGILHTMIQSLIMNKSKDFKAIRLMPKPNVYAEIIINSFALGRVHFTEKFIFNGIIAHEYKRDYGVSNAINYIINRGYFIFGSVHDVDILFVKDITKDILISHYSNYCIPVLKHMQDVVDLYVQTKNDIIDVLVNGILNPLKLNNRNIKYTRLKGNSINNKEIMNQIKKQSTNNIVVGESKKLSYFGAIK